MGRCLVPWRTPASQSGSRWGTSCKRFWSDKVKELSVGVSGSCAPSCSGDVPSSRPNGMKAESYVRTWTAMQLSARTDRLTFLVNQQGSFWAKSMKRICSTENAWKQHASKFPELVAPWSTSTIGAKVHLEQRELYVQSIAHHLILKRRDRSRL